MSAKSAPKLSPTRNSRDLPEDPQDWPADYGDSEDEELQSGDSPIKPSNSDPSAQVQLLEEAQADSAPPSQFLAPTHEQWEDLKNSAILAALDKDDVSDNEGDSVLDGHPVAYILNKARSFESNFREHRMPTPPTEEAKDACNPKQLRDLMRTFGRRVLRASVSPAHQKKAAWRNFTLRTNNTLRKMISGGKVLFVYVISAVFSRGRPLPPQTTGGGGLLHKCC